MKKLPLRIGALLVTVVVILVVMRLAFNPQTTDAGSAAPTTSLSSSQLEANSPLAPTSTKATIQKLQDTIKANPSDEASYASLAAGFLQLARETGDPTNYTSAEQAINKALELKPDDVNAMVSKGSLMLSRHQFSDALALGEKVIAINPDRAANYGLIADAQVELGQYDQAVATLQKMVDLRPDLSSYSRISYVRELYGDLDGAIEAMQQAISAGSPSAENTNWCRVQLGSIYFTEGKLDLAEQSYQQALTITPDYLHALAGMGNVEQARGDYAKSVDYYTRATAVVPLPQYVSALGDVYTKMGDTANAKKQYDLFDFISQTYKVNGVLFGIEGAMFYADRDLKLDQALDQAEQEAVTRQDVHTNDTLAWVLYKMGRYDEAWQHAQQATRLGSKDPLILFHAGMIAAKTNQPERAKALLTQALTQNPHFHVLYADVAQETLKTLN